jgi:hypothetical protein
MEPAEEIEEPMFEQTLIVEEEQAQKEEEEKPQQQPNLPRDRTGFIHGLSVGLGIGCIGTFVILWITLFFTPQMPQGIQYEQLLSIFIFPLLYLLTVGLIALTAGIVKEYCIRK